MLVCRCGELMVSNGEEWVCGANGHGNATHEAGSGDRRNDVRVTLNQSKPVPQTTGLPGRPYSKRYQNRRCRLVRGPKNQPQFCLPGEVPVVIHRLFAKLSREKDQRNRRGKPHHEAAAGNR